MSEGREYIICKKRYFGSWNYDREFEVWELDGSGARNLAAGSIGKGSISKNKLGPIHGRARMSTQTMRTRH